MESAQMITATAGAGFDSMLHEQLLNRRQRLESARTHIHADDDLSRLLGEVDAAFEWFDRAYAGRRWSRRGTTGPGGRRRFLPAPVRSSAGPSPRRTVRVDTE